LTRRPVGAKIAAIVCSGEGAMEPDNTKFTSAKEHGRGYHDLGGLSGGPVDPAVTNAKPWEKLSIVLGYALGAKGKGLICTDEVRRTREEMGVELYNKLGYFEKGIESMRRLLIEKGLLDNAEIERRMAAVEKRIREQGR
jgi:hypothetical protein